MKKIIKSLLCLSHIQKVSEAGCYRKIWLFYLSNEWCYVNKYFSWCQKSDS